MSGSGPLVIFDCDGVLVDSEPIATQVLIDTLREAGLALSAEQVYGHFLGRSLASVVAILAHDFGIRLDAAALAGMRARIAAAFRADLRAMPHVADCLDALSDAGVAFCVASSSLPDRIALSLRVTGLWPRFETCAFSASMVAEGKPAPDLFLHAARAMGAAPARCLVVEDSPAGIEAARRAGMRAVGFAGGGHARTPAHRAALSAERPETVLDDLRDLRAWLDPARTID